MSLSDNQPLSIADAFKLAAQHQARGQLQDAEILLQKILQLHPTHGAALHLLGCIAHQVQKLDMAIGLIEKSVASQPDTALFHSNLAEMYRQAGQTEKAISTGHRAIELDPHYAPALSNLGIAYFDQEDYSKASHYQQQALAINAGLPQALNNLGSIARHHKEIDVAIDYYQQAVANDAHYAEALNNLGAVLTEKDSPEQGLPLVLKAIELQANYAEAYRNAGSSYLMLEDYQQAEIAFNQALHFKPGFTEAMLGLAALKQEANHFNAAEAIIQQVIEQDKQLVNAQSQLAGLYTVMGFPDKAMQHYEQALLLEPKDIASHIGKSHLLTELGQLQLAEDCLQQALLLDPDSIPCRLSLAQLKKVRADDKNFAKLKQAAEQQDPQAKTKAIALHFALGKSYGDCEDYPQSFQHFIEACRLKREKIHYSKADNTLAALNIITTFTKARVNQFRGGGDPSTTPIFILGMPRSGTTLTEQIIASHPRCFGAGELPDLSNTVANYTISGSNESFKYPANVEQLQAEDFQQLGQRYVASLRSRNSDAELITDKMPANYFYLGLIHLMLPNAKIIHVKRSPVDTCISGFSKLFKQGQNHSYDLAEMGAYYRDYHNIMQHWREVLPDNAFYEIQYEDLVANTEAEAKALIHYCGLAWDPQCLEFHHHQRSVKTASVIQVRQPIYTSSLERWRRYEDFLEPLFEALGDLAPER
ncbi:tetratricopeptide repeat-containing sulfotransferase family protein [Oceanicoccus sagamiensis]|uniref:Uncharacterized protein n=1 Tax=Oceanicoccus sagamiensis TaxID=716816 RepID=A0A1X9NKN9_9GAMM|nr:tetratricopeptide repeat-containing sulfotransferase family protein [Oceanicoccus sagamiensis]ARN75407.1 hypothetical protein BST96_15585 [Oceanicoccus sagamiensis]